MEFDFTNKSNKLDGNNSQIDYGPEFEECRIKMRRGFWVVVAMGLLSLVLAIAQNIPQGINAVLTSGLFIDAVVIAIFAVGVYRKSRASITLIFLYYVASKILIFYTSGTINGVLIVILMTLFLGQATFSTYKYHSIRKQHEPDYKPTGKLTWWVATPLYVVFCATAIYGFLYAGLDWGPKVITRASQLSADYKDELLQKNIIDPSERVEIFFSGGIYSLWTLGSVVTSDKVISYEMSDGELFVASTPYDNIAFVGIEQKGTEESYSHIYIETLGGEYFYLNAPSENRVDELIVNTIKTKMKLAQSKS